MRLCLISAPTATDFLDEALIERDAIKAISEHPPLGILSLAAVMEQNGVTPDIIDLNRSYYSWMHSEARKSDGANFVEYLTDFFSSRHYDVFGFSTICSSYPLTLRVAEATKRMHPQSAVILGGPQASVVDVPTMERFASVDYVLRGEAEASLPQLLNLIGAGGDAADIRGLTYRKNGAVLRSGATPILESLDELPFPAFHLHPFIKDCGSVPLELGRGCPFACTFCSTNDFFRRRFRLKSPQKVLQEMKRIKDEYGHYNFDLVHDMFTVDRKRVVAFCNALLDSGEEFYWGCSARTDCIDEELIALMAKAGCRGIFFGIETGSARLQNVLKKNLDLAESARMIEYADGKNIKTAVSLITCFPDETRKDLRDTVGFFMDSMRFDHADPQLCLLAPLAATPLEEQHRDELIFDDVISDMSFQGWEQDAEDRRLIAAHRDIFSNFYSIPTLHLDRQFVKELREFLHNGMVRFRWLLVGLHQDGGDIVEVFRAWHEWAQEHSLSMVTKSPAIYYAGPAFHTEFLSFLRTRYAPSAKVPAAIFGLIDYAAAFDPQAATECGEDSASDASGPIDFGGLIGPGLTPVLRGGVRVTPLQSDYLRIVSALREKAPIEGISVEGEVMVATSSHDGDRSQVLQLAPHSAGILSLCDGVRTVADICEDYSRRCETIEGVPAQLACVVGIEMLRRQGLVVLVGNAGAA